VKLFPWHEISSDYWVKTDLNGKERGVVYRHIWDIFDPEETELPNEPIVVWTWIVKLDQAHASGSNALFEKSIKTCDNFLRSFKFEFLTDGKFKLMV
jgi:hypothetical protein